MLLHLDAIDDFGLAGELLVVGLGVRGRLKVFLFLVLDWHLRQEELEVAAVQLEVDELVDHLADLLTVALHEGLDAELLDVREAELFQISQELAECGLMVAFEVAEIYEDSLLLALKAGVVSNRRRAARSTYLLFVQTHQPIGHVVQDVDPGRLVVLVQRRVRKEHPADALVLPAPAECVLVVEQA
jgi:hypothetical protein